MGDFIFVFGGAFVMVAVIWIILYFACNAGFC